jgi:hypothetical protein
LIIAVGAPRSGTSLTMAVLRALGCALGPTNTLNENTTIRDKMVKPLLSAHGFDPLQQTKLAIPGGIPHDPEWREKVMRALGPLKGRRPAVKTVKGLNFHDFWHAAFPEATWVCIRRDRVSNVDSLIRTSFMRAYGDDAEAWGRYHDQHVERMREVMDLYDATEVWPVDEIQKAEPYRDLAERLGLEYDRAAVVAGINPKKLRRPEQCRAA